MSDYVSIQSERHAWPGSETLFAKQYESVIGTTTTTAGTGTGTGTTTGPQECFGHGANKLIVVWSRFV